MTFHLFLTRHLLGKQCDRDPHSSRGVALEEYNSVTSRNLAQNVKRNSVCFEACAGDMMCKEAGRFVSLRSTH